MREALRRKTRLVQGQSAIPQSVPAPVGGWNARDALAEMPATDAIALENWFPRTSYCEIRGGYTEHATGMTGNGKTLAVHNALAGTSTIYCYTASGIYDVTSAGAVGASKLARTEGKHQWTMMGDGTSNWLIACNGVDKPAYFDGTTWTAVDNATVPALTGVTTTTLIAPMVFKGRLFFIEKDKNKFWYLAAGAVGGALTAFALDGEARRGGYLMALATLTVDAGDGPDDRFVAITSEGEVIIYQGTNPSSAASWEKVGSYFIGRPIGRRCVTQWGGDLVVLTQNGAFPLSKAIQSTVIDNKQAMSFKIENAFNDAAKDYFSVFGWKVIIYPKQSAMLVNIPYAEDGRHEQFVMNTITGAWCKFTGWNAEDFCIMGNEMYFTSGTKTYKAWTGWVDGTNDVVAYGKTAFSYFGRKDAVKKVDLFRPVLSANGSISFLTGIDVDFQDNALIGTASYSTPTISLWGTALWGTGLWSGGLAVLKKWTSPSHFPGKAISGKIKIANRVYQIQWMAHEYIFEPGGPL